MPLASAVEHFEFSPGGCRPGAYLATLLVFSEGREVGRFESAFREEEVDREGPVLALDAALAAEPLRGEVAIRGTVEDPDLEFWSLRAVRAGQEGLSVLLGSGSDFVRNERLAVWDTAGSDGSWVLVLAGRDGSGNATEATLSVTIVNMPAPILEPVGEPVSTPTVELRGSGLAGTAAHLTLNGVAAAIVAVAPDGSFAASVGPLREGENEVVDGTGWSNSLLLQKCAADNETTAGHSPEMHKPMGDQQGRGRSAR